MSENKIEVLSLETKISYLITACAMSGIHLPDQKTAHALLLTFEAMQLKGGDFSLRDGAAIQSIVDEMYSVKQTPQDETTPNSP